MLIKAGSTTPIGASGPGIVTHALAIHHAFRVGRASV